MTFLSTRELYALFLDSDFWINLSRTKRRSVGRCENCGTRNKLESHHVFYRDSWFDTQLSDLSVLCRRCHEAQHGIKEPITERPFESVPKHAFIKKARKKAKKQSPEMTRGWERVMKARSLGAISRKRFLRLKKIYLAGQNIPAVILNPYDYSYSSGPYRSKWVNRGSTSN